MVLISNVFQVSGGGRKKRDTYEDPLTFVSKKDNLKTKNVFIEACNQLFEAKAVYKALLGAILGAISRLIFWGICYVVLPPLPSPLVYMIPT